jgi:hypothetical protein
LEDRKRKLIWRRPIGVVGFMSGIPVVPKEHMECAIEMARYCARHIEGDEKHIEYYHTPYSFHSRARNDLAEKRVGGPDAWQFQLDLDIVFRPAALKTLLHTMHKQTKRHPEGLDVVCGMYYKKSDPHMPVIMEHEGKWFKHRSEIPEEPFQIGGGGGGCLLVRNRVFDRIEKELKEKPFDNYYYYHEIEEDGDGGSLSEDLSFFKRCQKLGIEVWCDPAVQCGHLATAAIGREEFERSKATLGRYGGHVILDEADAVVVADGVNVGA